MSEYCITVDRAVEHLPAAPMGTDLFCAWAGWMPVLSIWPLAEDQRNAVLFHLASPGRKLVIAISPFGGDQFDKSEVTILTLSLAVLQVSDMFLTSALWSLLLKS